MKFQSIFVCSISILVLCKSVISQSQCTNNIGTKHNGTCKSVDDCEGATLTGNCSSPSICCIPDIDPPNIPESSLLKESLFLKLTGNTVRNKAMYKFFVNSMTQSGVFNQYRVAAYLATLVGESNFFREMESKIVDTDNNADFGNNVAGDGSLYRGRGVILVRGKNNYILANEFLKNNLSINNDLLKNPELAAFPSIAFRLGSWFWNNNAFIITSDQKATKGSLNDLIDGTFHNFTLLTHSLTNDLGKLKNRTDFNELVLKELNYPMMKRGKGIECRISSEKDVGYAIPICLSDFKRSYCGCEGAFDIRSCPYGLSGTKCRSSSIIKCCVEKCNKQLDLVSLNNYKIICP